MFRDGQYLEVIKASDNSLATAVVTVQQKTIEIKKKKVSTNKWLDLEDWAALYKVLERAILKVNQANKPLQQLDKCEWKKSTRQLDITYTFDSVDSLKDNTSLPTIRVTVSPARRKTETSEPLTEEVVKKQAQEAEKSKKSGTSSVKKNEIRDINDKISKKQKSRRYLQYENLENERLEEYVPDAPTAKKPRTDSALEYVPSRKSVLEGAQDAMNMYIPTPADSKSTNEVMGYVPNSIATLKSSYEEYKPYPKTVSTSASEEYVPNSKGVKPSIEEYEPDFTSKSMKFDNSYVPSRVKLTNSNAKTMQKSEKVKTHKQLARRKEDSSAKKKADVFLKNCDKCIFVET